MSNNPNNPMTLRDMPMRDMPIPGSAMMVVQEMDAIAGDRMMPLAHELAMARADYTARALNASFAAPATPDVDPFAPEVVRVGDIAIVSIDKPVYVAPPPWAEGYLLDAAKIAAVFTALAADPSVTLVVQDLNTPGGASSARNYLQRGYSALSAAGKGLTSFVGGIAASLGMYMASAGTEVVATSEALLGSIGTIDPRLDYSGMYAQMGIRAIHAADPAGKAQGYPAVTPSPEYLASRQRIVEVLSEEFIDVVAQGRRMSVEQVRALNAGVFIAKDAVAKGLADRIVPSAEAYLGELSQRQSAARSIPMSQLTLAAGAAGAQAPVAAAPITPVTPTNSTATSPAAAASPGTAEGPASFAALDAAFKGHEGFVATCQREGLTLSVAKDRFIAYQQSLIDTSRAEAQRLAAENKTLKDLPSPGAAAAVPIGKAADAANAAKPTDFEQAVQLVMQRDKIANVYTASAKAAAEFPDLNAAYRKQQSAAVLAKQQ